MADPHRQVLLLEPDWEEKTSRVPTYEMLLRRERDLARTRAETIELEDADLEEWHPESTSTPDESSISLVRRHFPAHVPASEPEPLVPLALLHRLVEIYVEFTGPAAPFLVNQELKRRGSNADSLPKSALSGLVHALGARLDTVEARNDFLSLVKSSL